MIHRNSIKLTLILFYVLYSGVMTFGQKRSFDLSGHKIEVEGDLKGFKLSIKTDLIQEGLEIATINIHHPDGAVPPSFSLKWQMPSANVAGYWSSANFTKKTINPDWWPSQVKSMLSKEAPVITLFGHDDQNRNTFAVSDALNTVVTSTSVREEDGLIYNQVSFFTEVHKEIQTFEIQLRMDNRPIPYFMALNEVSDWWTTFEAYSPLPVPEVARLPVYSTWYSYHQNVSAASILKECKLAKEMGFESIIVDDGWQTLDGNRGYAFTGDWEPERIPEMKNLVKQVHDLGMKFVLWYALPFVGEKSEAYDQLKGKFLRYWNGQGAYVLDPRFPEVRTFIIDTYVKAVKEWNLDGFKLDFIGRFVADDKTILKAIDGRDFASVNEATHRLMTDLVASLKAVKADIMIEFRQPYAGPAMRKYGNMFRAADCPNLGMINRLRTTDLKMISGNTAVHSDMLMWHYEESVEVAALQLLNVLFSVPQISVRLEDIPEDHVKMIQFYLDYWLENQTILLDGRFEAIQPLANYPMLSAQENDKRITAIFSPLVVPVETDSLSAFDIVNAKTTEQVVVAVQGASKVYTYTIFSCLGEKIKRESIKLQEGAFIFEVPASGMISFTEN